MNVIYAYFLALLVSLRQPVSASVRVTHGWEWRWRVFMLQTNYDNCYQHPAVGFYDALIDGIGRLAKVS